MKKQNPNHAKELKLKIEELEERIAPGLLTAADMGGGRGLEEAEARGGGGGLAEARARGGGC